MFGTFFPFHILNFNDRRFLDWAALILYGHLPNTIFQAVYAQLIQLLWVGLLGIMFAFLIPTVTSRGYLIKGVIYGLFAGLLIYAVPTLFQYPLLTITSTQTVVSNHIGGVVWGLTMAYTLHRLDTTPLKV